MQLLPKPKKNRVVSPLSTPAPWQGLPEPGSPGGSAYPAASHCDQLALDSPILADHIPSISSIQKQQRVVILVDGSNLFYAASYLHLEIDYIKLLHCLTDDRRLIRAYFYTGVDPSNDKQQGFLHWLRRHGYRVVAKELVQFPDGSKKANLEVEMAIDMMMLAQYCDTVILLSGDGDLTYAVNKIAYQGTRIEIVSLRSMTNDHLIDVADQYIDLETLKFAIQRG
ncbi:NYN domain-containing protein [Pantanalinema rosaneae CENA516]|uniref:LabA-like NYN domain-containing protein n=1 Tax=Pantanalinema rosaneae TaxID=1620701 RepID=UPI003D6F3A9B